MSFETETALLLILARILHLGACLGLFGHLVAVRVLGRPAPRQYLLARFAVAMAVSALVWLFCVAASVGGTWQGSFGVGDDPGIVLDILRETRFGQVWFWRFVLMAGLLILIAAHRPARARGVSGWLIVMTSGALLGSLALTGHAAMGEGWIGFGQRLNHGAHLVAAAVWLGGLWPLAALVRAARAGDVPMSAMARALARFSWMGGTAVGVILGTGVGNLVVLTGGDWDLLATIWGSVLITKLGFVLGLLLLALVNRFRLLPRLSRAPEIALRQLAWTIGAEQGCGLIVLILVGWLGTLAPLT